MVVAMGLFCFLFISLSLPSSVPCQECQRYLAVKGFASPDHLAEALRELLGSAILHGGVVVLGCASKAVSDIFNAMH